MIVPEPLSVLVLVVLSLTPPAVVVVVVDDVCAKAVLNATAPAAPAANNFINLVCFMFVLCFVKRMLSVVTNFDWSQTGLIQPQKWFVESGVSGRLSARYAPMISLRF